jgi:RimJ/RimL family protein N-acetyltransferase
MLHGERITLRARTEADIPVLYTELYEDVANHARADGGAWRPISAAASAAPYSLPDPAKPSEAVFSVVARPDGALLGDAVLWRIDEHNRSAHIGVALLPSARGQGYGTDVLEVLTYYGFTVLGLHRLQIETLIDNVAMRTAAEKAGFELEGTCRQASWVLGEFLDEVIYGRLA